MKYSFCLDAEVKIYGPFKTSDNNISINSVNSENIPSSHNPEK